ncbi:MAG: phosphoribosylanthranilate isomerase [Burkholderiaceae bacterium]
MDPTVIVDGHTRIKLCGMTREEDVDAAVALGVDALGFVFWEPSPRFVSIERAVALVARVPPTITAVGLFVDASRAEIDAFLDRVPLTLLQFHGDELPADCAGYRVPFIKAARVTPSLDLIDFAASYPEAQALLLDTHTVGYGGSGKVFDWSLVPHALIGPAAARRVVLSGGLNAANVADAIARVRPWAVDTSSGIEKARGIKDPDAMRDFVAAVRSADRSRP